MRLNNIQINNNRRVSALIYLIFFGVCVFPINAITEESNQKVLKPNFSNRLDSILGNSTKKSSDQASSKKSSKPSPATRSQTSQPDKSSATANKKSQNRLDSVLGKSKSKRPIANGKAARTSPKKLDSILSKSSAPVASKSKAQKQHAIGSDYLDGKNGRPKDKQKAINMFRKSVDSGYLPAMVTLARLVPNEEAAELLFRAADLGSARAISFISTNFTYGSQGFPEDWAMAREWAHKANRVQPGLGDLNLQYIQQRQHDVAEQQRVEQQRQAQQERDRVAREQRELREQKRQEKEALARADREYKKKMKAQQASAEKAQRRARAQAEANEASERNAQMWRDTVAHIQNVGSDIRNDLQKVQRDTAKAYKHDKRVQQQNEKRIKADYEKKKQAILAENERKRKEHKQRYGNQDFSRKAALASATNTASSNSLMPGANTGSRAARDFQNQYMTKAKDAPNWDCKNNWRATKCGDRIVTYNINDMGATYTGGYKKIAKDKDFPYTDPRKPGENKKPRIEFKKKESSTNGSESDEKKNKDPDRFAEAERRIKEKKRREKEEQDRKKQEQEDNQNSGGVINPAPPATIRKKSKITGAPLYKKPVAGPESPVNIITLKDQIKLVDNNPGHYGWGNLTGWSSILTVATCKMIEKDAYYDVKVKNDYDSQRTRTSFDMFVHTPSGKQRYPSWPANMAPGEERTIRSFSLKNTDCLTGATIILLQAKHVAFKEDNGLYAAPK